MSDFLPRKDGDLRTWLINFQNVSLANAGTLGLTAIEETQLVSFIDDFNAGLDNALANELVYRQAVSVKDEARSDVSSLVRGLAREWRGNESISNDLLVQLGLTPRNTGRTTITPQVPQGLSALGCSNGVNTLKWKRNGNPQGVLFMVEARYGNSQEWELVTATTRVNFDHEDQVPGDKVTYRVYARANNKNSAPSNLASVYDEGGSATLSLAA